MVSFQNYLPDFFELAFPLLLRFMQKFSRAPGPLRDIPTANLVRTFAGLMLGYKLTEQLLAFQMPADANTRAWDDMVEIFLHGILVE